MNIYEKFALILNLCLLIFIILRLMIIWSLAFSFLLVMLIISLYKISFDQKIEKIENKLYIIEKISNGLENIMESILKLRDDFMISVFRIEKKVENNRKEIEEEIENRHREMAKKVIEIENKMNEIKKSLAGYISYVEDSLKSDEKKP
jgi:hypothetical protein